MPSFRSDSYHPQCSCLANVKYHTSISQPLSLSSTSLIGHLCTDLRGPARRGGEPKSNHQMLSALAQALHCPRCQPLETRRHRRRCVACCQRAERWRRSPAPRKCHQNENTRSDKSNSLEIEFWMSQLYSLFWMKG
eukprot:3366704-Amphidinium_carterae.1